MSRQKSNKLANLKIKGRIIYTELSYINNLKKEMEHQIINSVTWAISGTEITPADLNKIMSTILGGQRLPMLIIDQNPIIKDRSTFNARATAIYGFSIFGKNHTYLLNDQGKINYNLLNVFLSSTELVI